MAHERALFVTNWGIGNNIIMAPIFEQLDRTGVFGEYHVVCRTEFLPEDLARHVELPGFRLAEVPPLTRRFSPADWDGLLDYLRRNGIGTLVNVRLEIAALDGNYLNFRSYAGERGVDCWDLHEDGLPEHSTIGQRVVALLRNHGVDLAQPRTTWLAPLCGTRTDAIGCFVGASRGVKRWTLAQWTRAVHGIRKTGRPVQVAAGPQEVERRLAAGIIAASGDPLVTLAAHDSVPALANWVADLGGLISNDTAAAHLAAATATPVVSLHLATDGRIWRPWSTVARPMQSQIALRCKAMKADGTCTRLYRGCPAPCRKGVTPDQVLAALDDLITPPPVPALMSRNA